MLLLFCWFFRLEDLTTPAESLRVFRQVDFVLVAVDVVHVKLVLPLVRDPEKQSPLKIILKILKAIY